MFKMFLLLKNSDGTSHRFNPYSDGFLIANEKDPKRKVISRKYILLDLNGQVSKILDDRPQYHSMIF